MAETAHDLLTPMFGVLLLTILVWCYMYARRIPFINTLDLGPDEITPEALARLSPPAVSTPSDNLKNLFELPVVFYAVVLYLHFAGLADGLYVTAAWGFFLFRVLHSAVHCTVNVVLVRFGLYALAALCLWFIVLRAALTHLTG